MCVNGVWVAENSILLCVLPRLNNIFNQSINQHAFVVVVITYYIFDVDIDGFL